MSIRAYLTEFRALNNFARATGEALREKVDLAMPDAVLDKRFAHYLVDFADDEGFLQATHQAGLQVEKKKALRAAKEAIRSGATPNKDGMRNDHPKRTGRKATNDQVPRKELRNPGQATLGHRERTPGCRKMRPSKGCQVKRQRNTERAGKTAGDAADQATGPTTASPSRRYMEQPCHQHRGRSRP